MDSDAVVLGLQAEIQNAARKLESLARAATYLGRPELSGMLGCMAGLLEEQAVLGSSPKRAKPATSQPRRRLPIRRARPEDFSQRA